MSAVVAIREQLCTAFCKDIAVRERAQGAAVSLPVIGRDGDHITAYVDESTAGWRVSDMGTTLMRLSYENDLSRLLSGARQRLFDTVLQEAGAQEDDGEIYVEVPANDLARGLFTLGQAALRIEDLALWTRTRVESTFRDDLRALILDIAGSDRVHEDYEVPNLPDASSYRVDFHIVTPRDPLYLFGIANRADARLATIVLQHLAVHARRFDSMVVYADLDDVPNADQRRLMTAANDSVPNIAERGAIRAKIEHRLAA